MKLIKCGTKAIIKLGNSEAIITGISIRFSTVSYELSYFINGEYKSTWFNECEFNVDERSNTVIGFK